MDEAHIGSSNALVDDHRGEDSDTAAVDCAVKENPPKHEKKYYITNECERSREYIAASEENSIPGNHVSIKANPNTNTQQKEQSKVIPTSVPGNKLIKLVFNLNPACHLPSNVPYTSAPDDRGSVGIMSTCKLGASSVQMTTASSKCIGHVNENIVKMPVIPIRNIKVGKDAELVPLNSKKRVPDTSSSIMSKTQTTTVDVSIQIQKRPFISTKSVSLDSNCLMNTNGNEKSISTQEENLSKIKFGQENTCTSLKSNEHYCSRNDNIVSTSINSVNYSTHTVPSDSKTINTASTGTNLITPLGVNVNRMPIAPVLQQNAKSDLTKTHGTISFIPANKFLRNILPNTTDQAGQAQPTSSVTNNISGNQTVQSLGNSGALIPNYYIVVNNNLQGLLNLQSNTLNKLSTSVSLNSSTTSTAGTVSTCTSICSFSLQQLLSNTAISQTSSVSSSSTTVPYENSSLKEAPAANILNLGQLLATPPANPLIWTIPVNVITSTSSSSSVASRTVDESQRLMKDSRTSEGKIVHPLLRTPPKKIRIEPLKAKTSKKKLKDIKPKTDKPNVPSMKSVKPNESTKVSDSITNFVSTSRADVVVPKKEDGLTENRSSDGDTNTYKNSSQVNFGHVSEVKKNFKFKHQFWVPPSEEYLPAIPKKKVKRNVAVMPKQKGKRNRQKGRDLEVDASLPKPISQATIPTCMLTPPSSRDKRKQMGPSSGTKRKLKKKLQNSSKVKKPRVENEMSKYISVLKVKFKSAAQGKSLDVMLKGSGQRGFSVSNESRTEQCFKSLSVCTTTGVKGNPENSCVKTLESKRQSCTKQLETTPQCIEARSDLDMNNNARVRCDTHVSHETNMPIQSPKLFPHDEVEKAESKGPVLFSFLQDEKLPNTTLQTSNDTVIPDNPEQVQVAVLENIEKQMRVLAGLPQSVLMKAPTPGPLPVPSMWANRYALQKEKSCLGRLTLVLKDAHLNLRQSLMGDKVATERLKRKLVYAESLVRKYRDFVAIRLHTM